MLGAANSGFACIVRYQRIKRAIRQWTRLRRKPVLFEYRGNNMPPGDLEFSGRGVAGHFNDFHSVKKRRGNGCRRIGVAIKNTSDKSYGTSR